ncbi:hypothetical protein CMV_027178 [Castanea mollissima]|uniref:Uncharacterized protein n=1 Tax=Castanea mollissima TaxID=60419 RepID=A0A8J4QFS2_9ROSI|nr:hypothetical protein CMV_027178 [Castanea mollissima]
MKKSHEHHSQQRQQRQNSTKVTEHKKWNYQKWVSHFLYLLRKFLRKWVSLHLSLTNHLRLNAFKRPRLSTVLWDIVIFLVCVAAEVLGQMFLEDCNLKKGCSLCLKLQLGRINEICGQEAYSKTNLALHIIKEAQIKSVELMSVAT